MGDGAEDAEVVCLGIGSPTASDAGCSRIGDFAFRVRGLAGSVGDVLGALLRAAVVFAGAGEDVEAGSGRGVFRGRPRIFAVRSSADIGAV